MENENPPIPVDIDLTDGTANQEIQLTLTRGQLQLINEFLAQNIQPRGYEMIAIAYDLFKRLDKALDQPEQMTFGEAIGDTLEE